MNSPPWPPEKVERLAHLWTTTRMTARAIGMELGYNRNAVIGRANRLKLTRPPKPTSKRRRLTSAELRALHQPQRPRRQTKRDLPEINKAHVVRTISRQRQPQRELSKSELRQTLEQAWLNTAKLQD